MDAKKGAEGVAAVDVHTARGLLGRGHRYLDVRTVEEYNDGHVEGALNVPYMFTTSGSKVVNPEFLDQVSKVCKKDDQLVVGCQSGARARLACVDLLGAGYEDVTNLEGGYSAWVDAGFAGDAPPEKLKTACKFRS